MLEVREVQKALGDFRLGKISFTANRGEIFGILGPNGAGKTTTLRIVAGILKPDSGEVTFSGKSPEEVRDSIGYLPEERGLYRKWKVREVLRYFSELKGNSADTDYWLERFGLTEHAGKRVDELSKGMQQKVQLIVAIQHDPDLLILDEPFSGLDAVNINLVMELVREMRERGRCVVISTHILNLAERLCDRVLLINKGMEILSGSIDELSGDEICEVEYVRDGRVVKEITDRSLRELLDLGYDIVSYRRRRPSLEEIFLKEVGR
ncbi:ATP-binding cassette domain-containing protein [Geoglobus acetivorans]|uniref:ATP-binding cassette domain-containing protein n=1 Tax=Geoglobus acetivorans TaxID=565033 RepID=A0ABZ3H4J1_GEOAI|nr:ATP-binding cassette domain-containing protein [Geoglobus acetivorans]